MEALHEARVQYGIARGHQMMGSFSTNITECSGHGLQNLVNWKDARIAPCSVDDIQTENQQSAEEVQQVTIDSDETNENNINNSDTNDTRQVT